MIIWLTIFCIFEALVLSYVLRTRIKELNKTISSQILFIESVATITGIHQYENLEDFANKISNLIRKQDIDREVFNNLWGIIESLETEKVIYDRKINYRNKRIIQLEILLSKITWDKKHLRWRKLTK
jgi:hypothetical protein